MAPPRSSEITSKSVYLRRRDFLRLGAGSALLLRSGALLAREVKHGAKLPTVTKNPRYDPGETGGSHHSARDCPLT